MVRKWACKLNNCDPYGSLGPPPPRAGRRLARSFDRGLLRIAGFRLSPCKIPVNPAPGFRDAGNNNGYGKLWSVGTYGFGWSSAEADTNARFLYFSCDWIRPDDSYGRAGGLPLRCLQE